MSSEWLLLSFSCRSRRTIDLLAVQQRGRSAGLGGLSRTVRCYPAVPPLICRCYFLPFFRQETCSFKRLDVLPAISPLVTAAARRCGRLAHRRHDVFGAGADAGRPARRHGLEARVEAHALGAVDGHVAEQRALPAAKAVERHRHRYRHVDPDHADLPAAGKFTRGTAVARKDRDAVAVFMLAGERWRL